MSMTISKVINFQQTIVHNRPVSQEAGTSLPKDSSPIGGIIPGTNFAWLVEGPHLQVININTGFKCGSWTFGYVLRDPNAEIVNVEAIPKQKQRPDLAVAVNYHSGGGMICVFDFPSSKIKRAIQIGEKITSLHVLANQNTIYKVPGVLRKFDGILAVGTEGGSLLLINLCLDLLEADWRQDKGELNPCQLNRVKLCDIPSLENLTRDQIKKREHLAINLNEHSEDATKHFTLKGPSDEDVIYVNKEEVTVSALFYSPHIGSLLVGYNFGAFQIYNLMNFALDYTSNVLQEHIPVSHFTFQEPADDPRSNCYIWAVYSYKNQAAEVLPFATLHVLCYHTKQYRARTGLLYERFYAARIQYEMKLSALSNERKGIEVLGGNCLGLSAARLKSHNSNETANVEEESGASPLCFLAWNIWYSNGKTETYTAIFDLNQWYRAQLPRVPDQHFTNYVIITGLNELVHLPHKRAASVLNVVLKEDTIRQFVGAQKLEEHFYPNSLAYNLCCLRLDDAIFLRCVGAQRALLAHIESSGVLSLVEPTRVCGDVITLGLVPVFTDVPDNAPITTTQQREIILGAALENHLFGWICKCAAEWANGSFLANGCSLGLILNWAFQRVITLKTKCNEMCEPLFDYSGRKLDNNTLILLKNCITQMKDIHALYIFALEKLYMFVADIHHEQALCKSLQTIDNYFEVLEWFLNTRLLPECSHDTVTNDVMENLTVPYPNEILSGFYNHRRTLLKAAKNAGSGRASENCLFIDKLINSGCEGRELQEEWISCGGNGLYPPPSFQALLRTYLIESLPLPFKNAIVLYFLFDLTMILEETRYSSIVSQLVQFPSVFRIKQSAVKLTQAFWRLDHGEFNSAIGLLLDPLISTEELSDWQHTFVLQTLLAQGQHHFALLYFQIRKPKLKCDDDIVNAITLYVANNILDEAFNIAKRFHDQYDENKYILHFFSECLKVKQYKSLILRALSQKDEQLLLRYLSQCKNAQADDLKFYYHVLRGQLIEAFDCHDHISPIQVENQGLLAQENASARDRVVDNLKRKMPQIIKRILEHCRKQKIDIQEEMERESTPLSLFYLNAEENKQYKSDIIGAALAKTKKTYQLDTDAMKQIHTETTPFLRNPTVVAQPTKQKQFVPMQKISHAANLRRDPLSPPPAKRLKLTQTNLATPIVKRRKDPYGKSAEEQQQQSTVAEGTPHSILKVKSVEKSKRKKDEERKKGAEDEGSFVVPSPVAKRTSNVASRKSLRRSSIVRFEGFQSSTPNASSTETSKTTASRTSSTRTSTTTGDETFYSPPESFQEPKRSPSVSPRKSRVSPHKTTTDTPPQSLSAHKESAQETTLSGNQPDNEAATSSESNEDTTERLVYSPTVRKSVKRSYPDESKTEAATPDRSSEQGPEASTPRSVPRLRARKSLCRSVLESNTMKLWESTEVHERTKETVTRTKRDSAGVETTSHTTSKEKSLRVSEVSEREDDDDEDSDASWVYKRSFSEEDSESDVVIPETTFEDVEMEESDENTAANSPPQEDDVIVISSDSELLQSPTDNADNPKRYSAQEVAKIIETAENVLNTSKERRESSEQMAEIKEEEDTIEDPEDNSELNETAARIGGPRWNVFEVSKELDVVGDTPIIKEVDLEDPELSYEQDGALEVNKNVLEEAILEISSDMSAKSSEECSSSSSSSEDSEDEVEAVVKIVITQREQMAVGIKLEVERELQTDNVTFNESVEAEKNVFEITDDLTGEESGFGTQRDITEAPSIVDYTVNVLDKNIFEDVASTSQTLLEQSQRNPVSSSDDSSESEEETMSKTKENSGVDETVPVLEKNVFEDTASTSKTLLEKSHRKQASSSEDSSENEEDTISKTRVDETANVMEKNVFEEPTAKHVQKEVSTISNDSASGENEEKMSLSDDSDGSYSENESFLPANVKKTLHQCSRIDLEEKVPSPKSCSSSDSSFEEDVPNPGGLTTIAEEKEDASSEEFILVRIPSPKNEEVRQEEQNKAEPEEVESDKQSKLSTKAEEKNTEARNLSEENITISPESPLKLHLEESFEKEAQDKVTRVTRAKKETAKAATRIVKPRAKKEPVTKTKARSASPESEKKSHRKKPTAKSAKPTETTNVSLDKSSEEQISDKKPTARKRTIAKSVSDVTELPPARSLRPRTRSVEERAILTKPTKRKRSNSEDQETVPETTTNRKTRAASVPKLATVVQEPHIQKKKPRSVAEGAEKTRRVTRTQAALLKKVGNINDLAQLDPIVLLDKTSFKGKPDLEEKKIYETSPTSSSSTIAHQEAVSPPRRRRRAASVTSTTSKNSDKSRGTSRVTKKKTATTTNT